MMGDFNDFDGKILDVNNNKPTSQVLDILKGDNLFSAAENGTIRPIFRLV